jgi:hypothetical protein
MSLLQSSEDLTGSASYKHFAPTELKPQAFRTSGFVAQTSVCDSSLPNTD